MTSHWDDEWRRHSALDSVDPRLLLNSYMVQFLETGLLDRTGLPRTPWGHRDAENDLVQCM